MKAICVIAMRLPAKLDVSKNVNHKLHNIHQQRASQSVDRLSRRSFPIREGRPPSP